MKIFLLGSSPHVRKLFFIILDKTFNYLTELSLSAEVEPDMSEMLSNLVKLRNSNWGHSPPSSAQVKYPTNFYVLSTDFQLAFLSIWLKCINITERRRYCLNLILEFIVVVNWYWISALF